MLDVDVEVDRSDFTVRAAVSVARGGRLALFGPSGVGKTTLLETIAGLVPPRQPPCFNCDGAAVPIPAGDCRPVWPEQVSA